MPSTTPQCAFCWHHKNGACAAFPEGIPDLIRLNSIPHERPMLGQEGDTVYRPLPQHAMEYPSARDHFEPAQADEEPDDDAPMPEEGEEQ